LSTGYYPSNCDQCNQSGGQPFTNTADTLVFWYKYTAVAGSKGSVSFMLKKNGNIIGGNQLELEPTLTFLKIEIPIQTFQAPDTLTVDFQSSRWTDSLPDQSGAVLIVDEVQLKSQPLHTSIFKIDRVHALSVYPNPASKEVNIRMENITGYPNVNFKLVNALGQTVYVTELSDPLSTIDLRAWQAGAYFFQVESAGKALQSGRLIVE
jgi:hypothetical protein